MTSEGKTPTWDARSFRERMDDETLLYAASKLAEIRPGGAPNRKERDANGDGSLPAESVSSPQAEGHYIGVGRGRNRAVEAWRRHTCGSIHSVSGRICQMPRGHNGDHTAYRTSWDDEHASGNRYHPDQGSTTATPVAPAGGAASEVDP